MRVAPEKMDVWLEFNGHYEKHECDIMLKDGTIVDFFWPNGGLFSQQGGGKLVINSEDILKIRYHDYFSKLKH